MSCKSCGLHGITDSDNLCIDTCSPNRRAIIHGAKENEVFFILKSGLTNFKKYFKSHDKVPEELSGCEIRRPDFIFESSALKVIVEVDEYQHTRYASRRMKR